MVCSRYLSYLKQVTSDRGARRQVKQKAQKHQNQKSLAIAFK
jgi:hypothetical protein